MTQPISSFKFYVFVGAALLTLGFFEFQQHSAHVLPKKSLRTRSANATEGLEPQVRSLDTTNVSDGVQGSETDSEGDTLPEISYRLPKSLTPKIYLVKLRPVFPYGAQAGSESLRPETNVLVSEQVNASATDNDLDTGDSADNEREIPDKLEVAEEVAEEVKLDVELSVPGEVVIYFECIEVTGRIVLHSHAIDVDEKSVQVVEAEDGEDPNSIPVENRFHLNDTSSISILGLDYDMEQDFFTVYLGEALVPKKTYKLYLRFKSTIVESESVATFGHWYADSGVEKYVVATKLQPTYARQVFPCFDEPEFKAIFYMVIGRGPGYHSLSNAPLNFSILDSDRNDIIWDYYQPTLIMSTYLVSFAISDFVSQSPTVETSRPTKLWAPENYINSGGGVYAMDTTVKITEFLEAYFNMSDPLPKSDSIMIPQFSSSAMENWGLITYKNSMIIYVKDGSHEMSEVRRNLVTTVVAHELSHNWFGNLVTCEWWSDVWLNEGFATYFSFLILEKLYPEFDPPGDFLREVHQYSMLTDPLPYTNPVRNSARTKTEVEGSFSRETYRKGASIVRMMRNFLTEDGLQQGLQTFMHKHAFGSVTQNDLYEAFSAVPTPYLPSNVTLRQIMSTWTLQSCYPLVRVSVEKPGILRLSQEKFTLYPQERQLKQDSTLWWIPIAMQTIGSNRSDSGTSQPSQWMPPSTPTVLVNGVQTNLTLIVNTNAAGYFSVLYEEAMLDKIADQLVEDHTVFSPITRSQLLHDYLSLTQARYVRESSLLKLTRYMGKETEYVVWDVIMNYIKGLSTLLLGSDAYHKSFRDYFLPKVEQTARQALAKIKRKPRPKETLSDVLLRNEIVLLACHLGSGFCYDLFKDMFRKWVADPETSRLPLGAEDQVLCAQVRAEGEPVWQFLLERYSNDTNPHAQWWYSKALTCTSDPRLVVETLKLIETNGIREFSPNRPAALGNLVENPGAPKVVFRYFVETFGRNSNISPELFTYAMQLLSSFTTEQRDVEELKACVENNQNLLNKNRRQSLNSAIETMKEKVIWMSTHGKEMYSWFIQNTSS